MKLADGFSYLAAGGLTAATSLAGASLADMLTESHVLGALVGGVCGLLSVVAKGLIELRKQRAQHQHERLEEKTKRYRRKLERAGIAPDTED